MVSDMRVLISVVITTYNSEKFIIQNINNILNQTFNKYEVIVIDDCSSDKTTYLLNRFSKLENFKLIRNDKNKGAAYSRNFAISLAEGEYIIFLDDDDIYNLDMLEKAYNAAKSRDVDMLVFRSRGMNLKTGEIFNIPWSIRDDLLPQKELFSAYDIKDDIFNIFVWWAWDKLIKKSIILESGIRFQEIRTTNDLFFVFSILLNCKKISKIDDILITHVFDRNNSLSNTREISCECAILALYNIYNYMKKCSLFDLFKISYYNYCISFLNWHLMTLKDKSFFKMYDSVQKFLKEMHIDENLLYDSFERARYNEILNLSASDFIVKELQKNVLNHDLEMKKKDNEIEKYKKNVETINMEISSLKLKISSLKKSTSWKITMPFRFLSSNMKKFLIVLGIYSE